MKFKNLTFSLVLSALALSATAADDLTPDIFWPDPVNGACLYGLSDNGLYGVSSLAPGEDGFSDFAGAYFFDLSTVPAKAVNLAPRATFATGLDVSDDGLTVAGAYGQKPAICRNENGTWTWYQLPIPDRTIYVRNVYTDEMMPYKLNGGEVQGITADGTFAVGYVHSNEYINLEVACMWDLTTMQIAETPGLDFSNSTFSRCTEISGDGRYVLYRNGGYSIYDREKHTTERVRTIGLDIYAQGMSPSGRYISGVVGRNDMDYAGFWDRETGVVTVIDGDVYSDAVAWTTTDDGVPLVARPYLTPYADGYVWHDNFLFSFKELLEQVYGINLAAYGIDNTGKPFQVSSDGRTIVMLVGPGNSYVIRLKEDIRDALDRIDLFRSWSAFPLEGTAMTRIGKVDFTFTHPIELANASADVRLVDEDGNTVARPLGSGGLTVKGNTLSVQFMVRTLEAGKNFKVVVPDGTVHIYGRPQNPNRELSVSYKGRPDVPVKAVSVSPRDGTALASLSLNENPVVVTYDNMVQVKLNDDGSRPQARLYVDGTELAGILNMDVDLYTGNKLVIFPDATIPLYKGSDYKLVVPDGCVVDMSGFGPSEGFSLTYTGMYVPQLGDDKYLFKSDCNDYSPFLFYEGDHGQPVQEYEDMYFTADSHPWSVVCDEFSDDMAFGSHSCYVDGRQADDWVITRQIKLPEGAEVYLEFDSQSHRKNKVDRLKVYVYENATVLNSLDAEKVDDIRANSVTVFDEILSPGPSESNLAGEWRHEVVDLTPWAGKSIYICFHNDNQNQSMVMIDNILVHQNVKAFITMRGKTNVVAQKSVPVRGILAVELDGITYNDLSMTLKDGAGNVVDTYSAKGLNLSRGDSYSFDFAKNLPLEIGEENPFTIEYSLDGEDFTYTGMFRDLAFQTWRQIVVEEFTGRDCQFCPGGIVTMEHLEQVYPNHIIPVALHCYQGTDPKGMGVMDYWEFTGMNAAPQARINRGPISSPLYSTSAGYVNTGASIQGEDVKLWKDYVIDALGEDALLDVTVVPLENSGRNLNFQATVKSAITLHDQNIRVFGVLVEDGLSDYQVNGYYATSDPLLGEWGAGGIYGQSATMGYTFDNVARAVWGNSYNGNLGLVPPVVNAGEEYTFEMSMPLPGNVTNEANCKFVVMLIDENNGGRVINAARTKTAAAVDCIESPADDVEVLVSGGMVLVESGSQVDVAAYGIDGRMLGSASGQGSFSLDLNGYRGLVIVKAGSKVVKSMAR